MDGILIDLIDRLDEVDDSERYESPCLFAKGGTDALPSSKACVCPSDETGSFICPQDPELSYVLTVQHAKEAVEVWSEWRDGRLPNREQKYAAVMFYARHDAWMPVD